MSRDTLLLSAVFWVFFRLLVSGVVSPWPRLLTWLPSAGTPATGLHHTRMEVRSSDERRWHRALRVFPATSQPLCALGPASAHDRLHGARCPGRVRLGGGAAHVHHGHLAPYAEEREEVSPQAHGSRLTTDTLRCVQRRRPWRHRGACMLRCVLGGASEASSSLAPLPSLLKHRGIAKAPWRWTMS